MPAAEKVIDHARETINKVPHATSVVAEMIEDGINTAKRVGKHGSDAIEELMDDTSNRVKRHPVESLVTAFAIGFIIGGLVDWLTRRK